MTWKNKLAELRRQRIDFLEQERGIIESVKDGLLDDEHLKRCDELHGKAEAIEKSDEFKRLVDLETRSKRVSSALADDGGPPDDDDDEHDRDRRRHAGGGGAGGGVGGRQTRSGRVDPNGGRDGGWSNRQRREFDEDLARSAIEQMMRGGPHSLSEEQRAVIQTDFSNGRSQEEMRSTMTTVGLADGAALVTPIMAQQLTEAMTVFSGLREMGATVINQSSGASMNFPTTDYSSASASEVGEGVADSTEETTAVGSVDIPSYECITPLNYISRSLLQDSAFDIVGLLQRKFTLAFDKLLAQRTVYGNGVNQMRGLIWDLCKNGDVVDTATSQTFVDGDFATAQANVGDAYKFNPLCKFAFSPEFAANRFLKLAGSDGQYLYRQAMNKPGQGINGQQWVILTAMGDSVTLPTTPASAACSLGAFGASATITAGRIAAIYGDASLYVIRNIQETLIERFEQETGAIQRRAVAFRAVRRIGGGWTSAATSSATRPMVALRVKT